MKASKLLRIAVQWLEQEPVDSGAGLCRATIKACAFERSAVMERDAIIAVALAEYRVLERIRRDLGRHSWLQDWVLQQGWTTMGELLTEGGKARLRATRIAWANDMIARFEAKGD